MKTDQFENFKLKKFIHLWKSTNSLALNAYPNVHFRINGPSTNSIIQIRIWSLWTFWILNWSGLNCIFVWKHECFPHFVHPSPISVFGVSLQTFFVYINCSICFTCLTCVSSVSFFININYSYFKTISRHLKPQI